jgi:rod shape-determining protein MreD
MEYIDKIGGTKTVVRRVILAVLLVATFTFQNTGGLFPAPVGIKAIILIPATICISMFEREFAGIFYGLAAGAMLDAFSAQSMILNSLFFTCIGFLSGALITYLMRNNLLCATIFVSASSFVYTALVYFFYYAFNGTDSPVYTYFRYFFPSMIYTILLTPFYYILVREISKKFK